MARAAHDEAIASLMRMTPAAKDRLIARLVDERDMLQFADHGRVARLDRQIASLLEVSR